MYQTIIKLVFAVALLFLVLFISEGYALYQRVLSAELLLGESSSFSIQRNNPDRIFVVVGDSTAVGTGSADKFLSVAGRLFVDFPYATIINKGQDGARMGDVVLQLDAVSEEHVDAVIIMAGGNDILFFKPLEESIVELERLIDTAKEKTDVIIHIPPGNMGLAPGMPPLLKNVYSKRSKRFVDAYVALGNKKRIHTINLWARERVDPEIGTVDKFFASDGLHLNSSGYGVWYGKIREILTMSL